MDFEKEAREILGPLFNQPHPFQKEWSPMYSMSMDDLVTKIAQALLRAHRQGQEEMREVAAQTCEQFGSQILKMYFRGPYVPPGNIYVPLRGKHCAESIRSLPLSIEEDK